MESYIFKDAVSTLSYKALNQTPSVLPGVVAMELGGKTDDPGASLIFLIVQVESVLFFFFFSFSHSAIDYVVIDKELLSSMLLKTFST